LPAGWAAGVSGASAGGGAAGSAAAFASLCGLAVFSCFVGLPSEAGRIGGKGAEEAGVGISAPSAAFGSGSAGAFTDPTAGKASVVKAEGAGVAFAASRDGGAEG